MKRSFGFASIRLVPKKTSVRIISNLARLCIVPQKWIDGNSRQNASVSVQKSSGEYVMSKGREKKTFQDLFYRIYCHFP